MEFVEKSIYDSPIPIEKDFESITIGWLVIPNATSYILQMKKEDDIEWTTLSTSLTNNIIRKKNLDISNRYYFRYKPKFGNLWSNESIGLTVLDKSFMKQSLPPQLLSRDNQSITLKWDDYNSIEGYNLRYRVDNDINWNLIESTIHGLSVRKKGLISGKCYYFALRPLSNGYDWSPSTNLSVVNYSPWLQQNFPSQLLSKNGLVRSEEMLAGKVLGIYFSASWCGPCRNFTPQLVSLHNTTKKEMKPFEIIFVSCDHSNEDFQSYYLGHHGSWLAIPYDDPKREILQGIFNVRGIPRFAIIAPSGRIICDNAAGQLLNSNLVDQWISQGEKL
jgi:thiol-disulfide isomerase/thioredoxin